MATIEGKPAAEWIRAAKERQAKGQFDETGARDAVQRMQGRAMPDYDAKGQIVRGPSGRTYNYKPTPAKPINPESPKPAPEPARQVAATPKPQDHASPAKPAPKPAAPTPKAAAKPAAPAPKPAAPAPRAKTASEEGQERIAAAKKMISEHLATSRSDSERQREISNWKIVADWRQNEENRPARLAQLRRDYRLAKPGPIRVLETIGEATLKVGGGIASAAKAARRYVGKQYSDLGEYAANEAEKSKKFYSGVGKWITGDPEAKKRLSQAAK